MADVAVATQAPGSAMEGRTSSDDPTASDAKLPAPPTPSSSISPSAYGLPPSGTATSATAPSLPSDASAPAATIPATSSTTLSATSAAFIPVCFPAVASSHAPFTALSSPRQLRPRRRSGGGLTQSHHGPVDPSAMKVPRVYVGNLAFSVGWQDLKDFFRNSIGSVGRVEIIAYPSGRSKGCAVVEFDSIAEAARAINELNNADIHGRRIFIREDREGKGFGSLAQRQTSAAAVTTASGGAPPGLLTSMTVSEAGWLPTGPPVYGSGMELMPSAPGVVGMPPGLFTAETYQLSLYYHQQLMQQQQQELMMHGQPPSDQEEQSPMKPPPEAPHYPLDLLLHQQQQQQQQQRHTPLHPPPPGLFGALYAPPPPHPFYPRSTFDFPLPPSPQSTSPPSAPSPSTPGCQVVVTNLPFSVTWQQLKDLAAPFGDVLRADVLVDRGTGRSRGVGLLRFAAVEQADRAVEGLRHKDVEGRTVNARKDDSV